MVRIVSNELAIKEISYFAQRRENSAIKYLALYINCREMQNPWAKVSIKTKQYN